MKTKGHFSFLLILTLLLLSGCSNSSPTNDAIQAQTNLFAMDTYMSFTAYGARAEEMLAIASERIAELEGLWSVTNENSDIYKINHSAGAPIEIGPETEALISYTIDLAEKTGGAFDPTLYPILTAWGFTTSHYQIPDDGTLELLLENTGYDKITLLDGEITIPAQMQIDMGAVGKGYAGDILADLLKSNQIKSALLDLGGNIQTIGTRPDGTPWRLGILDPVEGGNLGVLLVEDKAVITSGGYERFFEDDDGVRYWHILDPSTGKPARSGLVSVTVVGNEGRQCDALSTTLFVMGLDEASAFWRSNRNFDMILLTENDELFITEGIADSFTLNASHDHLTMQVIQR